MTTTAFEQRKRRFKDAFERLTAERGVDQDPLMQEWYAGTLPSGVMRGFVMEYYHWEFLRGFAATYAVCPHATSKIEKTAESYKVISFDRKR